MCKLQTSPGQDHQLVRALEELRELDSQQALNEQLQELFYAFLESPRANDMQARGKTLILHQSLVNVLSAPYFSEINSA